MIQIDVETQFPIAFDSYDHLYPAGTKNDNNTSAEFITDLENTFGESISFMDLGCAGGRLVHDLAKRGHIAVGLEGSDYNILNQNAEWPPLYQRNLFTCDVSREYSVFIRKNDERQPFLCDAITAWEVIEHIPPDRLQVFFENIRKHLKIGGYFFGSVGLDSDSGRYHKSVYPMEIWEGVILRQLNGLVFKEYPYSYKNVVRKDVVNITSFMTALQRIK